MSSVETWAYLILMYLTESHIIENISSAIYLQKLSALDQIIGLSIGFGAQFYGHVDGYLEYWRHLMLFYCI